MLATVSVPVCVRGTGHQATTKIFMLYRGVGVGVRVCVSVSGKVGCGAEGEQSSYGRQSRWLEHGAGEG